MSMQTRVLFLALIGIMVAGRAMAVLGETEAQIETRYSKPVSKIGYDIAQNPIVAGDKAIGSRTGLPVDDKACKRIYVWKGLRVAVLYLDGKSQWEEYSKISGAKFTQRDLQRLMDANKTGNTWLFSKAGSLALGYHQKEWILMNGEVVAHAQAIYKPLDEPPRFIVTTEPGAFYAAGLELKSVLRESTPARY